MARTSPRWPCWPLIFFLFFAGLFHFTFVALLATIVLGFFLGLVGNDTVFANFHFEAHVGVFIHEPQAFDGEMLRVIGEIRESGKRGGDFGIVPERGLGFFGGIDDVIFRAVGCAVAVPEFIREREPVGSDGEIEDELIYGGREETGFQGVVGRCDGRRAM